MAIFPCAKKGLCIDPSTPFANLSAELPDAEIFIGRNTGFGPLLPPLGSLFEAVGCTSFCESTISQADADLCAANANISCLSVGWPTSSPGTDVFGNPVPVSQNRIIFKNAAQSVTVSCPDGSPFVYTVPAGKYSAFSQAQADATALSDAQVNAPTFLVCIGNLSFNQICAGVPYNDSITATGNFLTDGNACWDIIGSLPPGIMTDLNFSEECFTGSRTLHFFGTPTIPGIYSFGVQVEDGRGDFMVKTVTIRVVGIVGVNPMPNGAVGMDYGFQHLTSVGVTNPIFSIEAGSLPGGLQLDTTGVIFGTPTTAGTFNFVLGVTEAGTGLTCDSAASITITNDTGCFTDGALPNAVVGVFYEHDLHPTPILDPGSDYTLTVVAGALPNNMFATDDFEQPQINGTPDTPGTYIFTIQLDEDPKGPAPGMPCTRQFTLIVDPICTGKVTNINNMVWTVANQPGNAIPLGTANGAAAGANGNYNDNQPAIIAGTQFPVTNASGDFCTPSGGTLHVDFDFNCTGATSGQIYLNGGLAANVWNFNSSSGHFTPSADVVLGIGTTTIAIVVGTGSTPGGGVGTLVGTWTASFS